MSTLRLVPIQDGGVVNGYTSLLALKEIFRTIELEVKRPVQPWEYFDLIDGTSTGGYIWSPTRGRG